MRGTTGGHGPSNIMLGAVLAQQGPQGKIFIDDVEVERKHITGGYNISKKNRCNICFTARSTSGACLCE